jgi:hypothetical protein
MFSEINQMLCASVPIFVAWIAIPAKALARTVYDGDWGVLILTRGGACEPAVRCGVQITGGMVIYSGGMATVQGRVSRRGSVQVSVRSGNWWANGCGRLGGNRGAGAWWGQGWGGQGTSGVCRGTWVAQRRE